MKTQAFIFVQRLGTDKLQATRFTPAQLEEIYFADRREVRITHKDLKIIKQKVDIILVSRK